MSTGAAARLLQTSEISIEEDDGLSLSEPVFGLARGDRVRHAYGACGGATA